MDLTPEQKQIDTLPLSSKDKILYEKWKIDRWSISYKEYFTTDHWAIIKKECAIWWGGRCGLSKTHYKLPMNVHHRDYKCLWREKFCDVIFLCQDCHERYHDIWPEINCKGMKYAGAIVMSECLFYFNDYFNFKDSKELEFLKNKIKGIFKIFVQDCSSCDKDLRVSARHEVCRSIFDILSLKFEYADFVRRALVCDMLIEFGDIIIESWGEKSQEASSHYAACMFAIANGMMKTDVGKCVRQLEDKLDGLNS